ncbi:glycerol-3-phosphate acyltransferase [Cohnella caldifontis]|uniref:glycerol-3-phosphate acyltransferase n=1 Tax=Cohnella caldifontis TaxID=3027471 RepID=UPI0023EC02FE|nr:glycerol-3-phosphate acyltransferase [Cohnella sp. YIM B05605]
MVIAWTALALLSGSLMFSYWLGLLTRHNIRAVGDGNPGGVNLWKAAGFRWGLAGIVLDFLKGYAPVWLFLHFGEASGIGVVPVAVAPVAGHAFSPFLGFKGGKGIAVTFGVWSALTGFEASLAYAVILAALKGLGKLTGTGRLASSEADAIQVVSGMMVLSFYLVARTFAPEVLLFWVGNFVLLAYTHWREWRSAAVKRNITM